MPICGQFQLLPLQNKKLRLGYIEWATSKEIQYKQALANNLPPRKSVLESPEIIVKNPEFVLQPARVCLMEFFLVRI